jgi:chorismate mutase/prephenate dehydratase
MTRIESRPSGRMTWDYVFFIDLEGHRQDEPFAHALAELSREVGLLRVLGSYPKGVL